jgi:hypothetical protein
VSKNLCGAVERSDKNRWSEAEFEWFAPPLHGFWSMKNLDIAPAAKSVCVKFLNCKLQIKFYQMSDEEIDLKVLIGLINLRGSDNRRSDTKSLGKRQANSEPETKFSRNSSTRPKHAQFGQGLQFFGAAFVLVFLALEFAILKKRNRL